MLDGPGLNPVQRAFLFFNAIEYYVFSRTIQNVKLKISPIRILPKTLVQQILPKIAAQKVKAF